MVNREGAATMRVISSGGEPEATGWAIAVRALLVSLHAGVCLEQSFNE
jgi:hypothetical protein